MELDKELKGLSDEEVIRARREGGANELEEIRSVPFLGKLVKNLGDPIVRILIVAFFVTLLFSGGAGSIFESLGIALSVVISTLVSTLSEYGSEKAFRRMQMEARAVKCTVIRNGKRTLLPVTEVVCGDLIAVKAGDRVGADGALIRGSVSVDMSAINGESAELHIDADGSDRRLFRGSAITAGSGIMRVSAVGCDTYYGKIASELQVSGGESPLREKLTALAKTLSRFGYFCAAVVAIAYLVSAFFLDSAFEPTARSIATELLHAFTLALSVVVVAVPEGLPMMITVVLSSNMARMQRQNIRVRKPVGIETAGSVDILFTDKTGTLTYGEPRTVCYVTGNGVRSKRSVDLSHAELLLLGACAVFAGDCRIENEENGKRRAVMGESADRALLSEYLESGAYPAGAVRTAFLPFDSRIKLSAARVKLTGEMKALFGQDITLVKGAPEIILKSCNGCYGRDGRIETLDREGCLERLGKLTEKGMRVLAVAASDASAETLEGAARMLAEGKTPDTGEILKGGRFLCFIGIRDEVRSESPRVIRSLRRAGIQTVMITGDARGTAVAVARECGILGGGLYETVLESEEMRRMSDAELARILPSLRVIARAMPDDKSRLVRVARSMGKITAMTGDGLNDAPALKAADVGFAMGNGTEVAKEAGDIILLDSNISSIEKAVLYGRTVFRSIRKFIVFQLIMNLSAVGVSVIGPLIGIESPVTVIQMLWINLIMDTLAAIAFAGEEPLERYMCSPPIGKSEPVLNGDMLTRIFVMGVYTVTMCVYYLTSPRIALMFGGRESGAFMSGFFALFVFCGVFGAFTARSGRVNIFTGLFQNPVFVTVIAAVFCAQIGMIYLGGELFRCVPLSLAQLKTVSMIAFSVIPAEVALEVLLKLRVPRRLNMPVTEK